VRAQLVCRRAAGAIAARPPQDELRLVDPASPCPPPRARQAALKQRVVRAFLRALLLTAAALPSRARPGPGRFADTESLCRASSGSRRCSASAEGPAGLARRARGGAPARVSIEVGRDVSARDRGPDPAREGRALSSSSSGGRLRPHHSRTWGVSLASHAAGHRHRRRTPPGSALHARSTSSSHPGSPSSSSTLGRRGGARAIATEGDGAPDPRHRPASCVAPRLFVRGAVGVSPALTTLIVQIPRHGDSSCRRRRPCCASPTRGRSLARASRRGACSSSTSRDQAPRGGASREMLPRRRSPRARRRREPRALAGRRPMATTS
jgi:hypothetical protein